MRTKALWICLLLVAVLGTWAYLTTTVEQQSGVVAATSKVPLQEQSNGQADPHDSNAGAPGLTNPPLLWRPIDPNDATSSIPSFGRNIADRRLVKLSVASISQLEAGSRFSVLVPQLDKVYAIEIQRVVQTGTATSIQGRLAGEAIPFPFVLTAGPGQTYASVNTPEGVYQLSGNDQLAWIVPARELARIADPSRPDFVVVTTQNEVVEDRTEHVAVQDD